MPKDKGTVYPRGRKLWVGYKDETGQWRYRPTRYVVGEEDLARRALDEIQRRIAAATRAGASSSTGPLTVERYASTWLKGRGEQGIWTVADETNHFRRHILPVLGRVKLADLRPPAIRDLVLQLKKKRTERVHKKAKKTVQGGLLAPKTVRNIVATLHTALEEAVADELIAANPCVLKKGVLPPKMDRDPAWRDTAIFTREEVELLISSDKLPADRRVVYGLLFVGAVRFGEGAALRWRDYDAKAEPLGRLMVSKSYNTKRRMEKGTKAERPRRVPVHATLARVLAAWRLHGWPALFGRHPGPEDLIIPSRLGKNRSVNHGLKRFHQDLARIGLRSRRQHDLRATFITLCQEDGGDWNLIKLASHGPKPSADMRVVYSRIAWEALCREVKKLRIDLREGRVIELRAAGGAEAPRGEPYYSLPTDAVRQEKGPASGEDTGPDVAGWTGLEPVRPLPAGSVRGVSPRDIPGTSGGSLRSEPAGVGSHCSSCSKAAEEPVAAHLLSVVNGGAP